MFDKLSKGITITCVFLALVAIAAAAGGAWALVNRLDERVLAIGTGIILTLIIVVVVAGVMAGKDVLQAYTFRRTIAQDDYNDLKKVAVMSRLMGTRNPNVNVKIPAQQSPLFGGYLPSSPGGRQQPQFVDTTVVDEPLDIE